MPIGTAIMYCCPANFKRAQYNQISSKNKKWPNRIGTSGCLIILIGSVILLFSVAMLAFTWKQSLIAMAGGDPAHLWRVIAISGWTVRVVTTSTAIMRTVVSLQASILTSMLAGVIIEQTGTPLLYAPLYSAMRALRGSPQDLLRWHSFQANNRMSLVVFALISIELLVLISSQFMSTVLISDFSESRFKMAINSTTVDNSSFYIDSHSYWDTIPAASWRFAKYSETPMKGSDFVDTGHTYRAFLPLSDEGQRTSLREFSGPALVKDDRVLCVSPLLTNLTFRTNGVSSWILTGNLKIAKSYPMLNNTPTNGTIRLDCALSLTDYGYNGTVLCHTLHPDGSLTGLLEDPLVDPSLDSEAGSFSQDGLGFIWSSKESQLFMIFDHIIPRDVVEAGIGSTEGENLSVIRNDGPWVAVSGVSGRETLQATACHINLSPKLFTVHMSTSRDGAEPKTIWDTKTYSYDTLSRRHQLGAALEPHDLDDRGILTLEPRSQWQDDPQRIGDDIFVSSLLNTLITQSIYSGQPSISFNDSNSGYPTNMFQDTLRATENPALALQALLTVLCQMLYYEALPKIIPGRAASTAFSSVVLVPARWSGFIGTAVILATHLAIVLIVTTAFLTYTSTSMLGNFWQGVSQVVTEETLPILKQADRMKDKEVAGEANSEKWHMGEIKVLRRREDGRVDLGSKENNGKEDTATEEYSFSEVQEHRQVSTKNIERHHTL